MSIVGGKQKEGKERDDRWAHLSLASCGGAREGEHGARALAEPAARPCVFVWAKQASAGKGAR